MSWPNRAIADPRRDGILLWLADYGAPPIAESASTLARMVGAARRVGAQDQVLLDVARDALTQPITEPGLVGNVIAGAGRSDDAVLEPLRMFAAAIDQLRVDAGLIGVHLGFSKRLLPERSPLWPVPAVTWASRPLTAQPDQRSPRQVALAGTLQCRVSGERILDI